jgi:hypothetical protein
VRRETIAVRLISFHEISASVAGRTCFSHNSNREKRLKGEIPYNTTFLWPFKKDVNGMILKSEKCIHMNCGHSQEVVMACPPHQKQCFGQSGIPT